MRTSKNQKHTRTRARAGKPKTETVAETLTHAAAIFLKGGLAVDARILAAARADGLPGFRGSRVEIETLRPHLAKWIRVARQQPGSILSKRAAETALLEERLAALREKNQKIRAGFIRADDFEDWRRTKANHIEAALRTRLQNRWAPQLVGLRAIEITSTVDAVIGEIFEDIRKPSGQQHRSKNQ